MKDEKLTNVLEDIGGSPGGWSFFQAVRRLECASKSSPRVGTSRCPGDDLLRFGQNVTLAFSPDDIASYEHNGSVGPSRMDINCFGILGSNGPLSLRLTEYIYRRSKHSGDDTFIAFLNMFHNRMISFLYRAWALYQPVVSCDRGQEDYFFNIFKSLLGSDYRSNRKSQGIEAYALAFYSGLLARFVRGRGAMLAILHDYFDVPVKLEQSIGTWRKIAKKYYCLLGESKNNSTLNGSLALGEKYWRSQDKFRVKLGPMPYKKYLSFLPGKPAFEHLIAWVKMFNLFNYDWELQLVLKADEVPLCGIGVQLGYTAWLSSTKSACDRDDFVVLNSTLITGRI